MKLRPSGFLSERNIDHQSELFDYVCELHEYLWLFIRAVDPGASGYLPNIIDEALRKAQKVGSKS